MVIFDGKTPEFFHPLKLQFGDDPVTVGFYGADTDPKVSGHILQAIPLAQHG